MCLTLPMDTSVNKKRMTFTFFYHVISQLSPSVTTLRLYSDGCGGQMVETGNDFIAAPLGSRFCPTIHFEVIVTTAKNSKNIEPHLMYITSQIDGNTSV